MEYRINVSQIRSAGEFHRVLDQTLNLPDWYGHNLDALFDCLTEPEGPVRLILENWNDHTDFSDGFRSVFEDAQSENPDFTVEFQ